MESMLFLKLSILVKRNIYMWHCLSMHTRNSSFINENLKRYWVYSIFKCIYDNDMYVLKLEHVQEKRMYNDERNKGFKGGLITSNVIIIQTLKIKL